MKYVSPYIKKWYPLELNQNYLSRKRCCLWRCHVVDQQITDSLTELDINGIELSCVQDGTKRSVRIRALRSGSNVVATFDIQYSYRAMLIVLTF